MVLNSSAILVTIIVSHRDTESSIIRTGMFQGFRWVCGVESIAVIEDGIECPMFLFFVKIGHVGRFEGSIRHDDVFANPDSAKSGFHRRNRHALHKMKQF